MTTPPKPVHIRADSGLGDIESFSHNVSTAQRFCAAVTTLTSEDGYQALAELLQLLPQRENEVKERDDKIRDLNARLAAQEKSHEEYNQKQLSDFEHRYGKWSNDNTALQTEIDILKVAAAERNKNVTALQEKLNVIREKVKDFEKEHTQMTRRLKEKDLKLLELEAAVQSNLKIMDEHKEKQKQSCDQLAALQQLHEEEANQHRSLKDDMAKTRDRLMRMMAFSVKIEVLHLPGVIERTEALWKSATELIRDNFGQNLPDNILQSDWTSLYDNAAFEQRISLPQSNTDVAKKMRVAFILRALARLIDKYIFQPTYLLDEDSGLRESLVEQATIDSTKERYARGILLSMFPEDQDTSSQESVNIVVKKLLNTVNVRELLQPDAVEKFTGMLRFVVTKFQDEWKTVQRGKQKLESSFNYPASTDRPWHVFDVGFASGKNAKQQNGVAAPLTTNSAEDDIVVLPRLYLVAQDADPAPITHGCVLPKALCDAAEGEVRKDLPSAPFARATSNRHRTRSSRTMSFTGDVAAIGRRGDSFLSQSRGSRDA